MMRRVCTSWIVLLLGVAAPWSLYAQDAPSLGDAARQARAQKQQKEAQAEKDSTTVPKDSTPKDQGAVPGKDASGQPAKPAKRVITNDEIPEHIGPTSTYPTSFRPQNPNYPQPSYPNYPQPSGAADQWKASILSVKSYMANLQTQIASLEQSIHYSSTSCASGCVQWNEHQRQKQEQVEMLKQQMEQQQKNLENMQEQARKQGFGSSVYDP